MLTKKGIVILTIVIIVANIFIGIAVIENINEDNNQEYLTIDPTLPPGDLVFEVSPLSLDYIDYIIPLGQLGPVGHTLPTNHIYFVHGGISGQPVYAPARGKILEIQSYGTDDDEIRLGVSNSKSYYLTHLNLSDTFKVGDWVETGTLLGYTTISALDLGVIDTEITIYFINPSRYPTIETIHCGPPIHYFVEPLRTQLYDKVHTSGDKDGIISYDIDGTLSGNWFLKYEDESELEELNATEYGATHLAFVRDPIYLNNKWVVSIGGVIFDPGVYLFQNESIAPPNVTLSTGKCTYKLYDRWNTRVGLLIVQLLDNRTIKIEAFHDTINDTRDFTSNYFIYER